MLSIQLSSPYTPDSSSWTTDMLNEWHPIVPVKCCFSRPTTTGYCRICAWARLDDNIVTAVKSVWGSWGWRLGILFDTSTFPDMRISLNPNCRRPSQDWRKYTRQRYDFCTLVWQNSRNEVTTTSTYEGGPSISPWTTIVFGYLHF